MEVEHRGSKKVVRIDEGELIDLKNTGLLIGDLVRLELIRRTSYRNTILI